MKTTTAIVSAIVAFSISVSVANATVALNRIATAVQPVFVTHAADQRLFVVELAGRIRIFDRATQTLRTTPFLDIGSKVATGGERGLLSMAFHPDYAGNGLFYVYYTAAGGDLAIERYKASADVADPTSAARLLTIPHPQTNHNGGQLQIGPHDGHLYIGTGDGGGAGDVACNSQRKDTLLGKVLRLDVRKNLAAAPYYGIPTDNPFVAINDPGNQIPDEIWATGLRNPWRFSFDQTTGDLFIGDVGQDLYEEINLRRAGAAPGANFGWKVMEGLHCYNSSACPAGTPACNHPSLTLPIHAYDHSSGCSVTGGVFYRGSRVPELSGRYVFADFCSGELRTLRDVGAGIWQSGSLLDTALNPVAFGQDADGEVYLLAGNDVWKLVSDAAPASVPARRPAGTLALGLGLALVGAGWLHWQRKRTRTNEVV